MIASASSMRWGGGAAGLLLGDSMTWGAGGSKAVG